MDIVLSTRNPSKAMQIQLIFSGTPVNVKTLDEANIVGEAVEDGTTLRENALKKASYAFSRVPAFTWTLAEDTGLFIRALGGEPGIKAARWAGEKASAEKIIRHTLQRLDGIADRSATFETVVALIEPDGKQFTFSSSVHGTILTEPRVPPLPGMPYTALFLPDGHDQVFAEMSTSQMNAISHRGKAFDQVRYFLARTHPLT